MQPMMDAGGGGVISNIPQLRQMPLSSHMLPPIVTAPEQPSRHVYSDRLAGPPSMPGAPQHPSLPPHPHPLQDEPSKRPRLYYDGPYQSEPGRVQQPAHGTPPSMQPTGHERYDQPQWPKDQEAMRRPQDACQTCADSRGLVEKVVSGLARLELELRQVLAGSPIGRAPKQASHSTLLASGDQSNVHSGTN